METGVYNSFKDIRLNSISPILEGYKGSLAPGLRVEWRNPLRFNGFDLTASYSLDPSLPARERPHLGLAYHFWNWTFAATYNNASFTTFSVRPWPAAKDIPWPPGIRGR